MDMLDPTLDSPSQKQFRKRLGREMPAVCAAWGESLKPLIQRIDELENQYTMIASLCKILMEKHGDVKGASSIIIPGR